MSGRKAFKIGDRVQVTKPVYSAWPIGTVGEVTHISAPDGLSPVYLVTTGEGLGTQTAPFIRHDLDYVVDLAPEVPASDADPVSSVYLSGPMRGHPDFNFPAFLEADKRLTEDGYTVHNPAVRDLKAGFDPIAGEYADPEYGVRNAFRWDVESILNSDAVVVLPGWQDSAGAQLEVTIARAIGIPALEYPSLLPIDIPGLFDEAYGEVVPETVLQEAQRLIFGDRQAAYGHPLDDFSKTAKMWSAIFGVDVEPEQVPLAMIAAKISRELNRHKRDNPVDIAGYAGTLQMVVEEKQRRGDAA